MCAASESSASEPASRPATTSTPMKPAMSASATVSQRRSASGRRGVRVRVARMLVVVGDHVDVTPSARSASMPAMRRRRLQAAARAPAPDVVPPVTKLLQSPFGYRGERHPNTPARAPRAVAHV